jgi:hypothetical protein
MGARVTVRTEIRKGMASLVKTPHFEGGSQLKQLAPDQFYATVGYPLKAAGEVPPYSTYLDSKKIAPLTNLSEDLTQAARHSIEVRRSRHLRLAVRQCLAQTRGEPLSELVRAGVLARRE